MRSSVAVLLVAAALAAACEQVRASAFNEPWCEVSALEDRPGHIQPGHYRIHPRLKAAIEAHNLSLLPFPTPASRAVWPNATTIESCRYMVYSPFHTDGLGSQYARMIHIAAWSYLYNVSYVHITPDHIDHGVNATEVDAFFNLGHGSMTVEEIPVGSTVCLVDHCGPAAVVRDHYRPQVVTQMLHGSLVQMKPMEWFSPHTINIGVHIRRGDVMERSKDINSGRWTPDSYYVDIIRNITADLRRHNLFDFKFHIYSQGDLADFANITGPLTGLPLTWHLNEDEILTLRGLICSDILVKAWSGLSTVAEWYSTAVTIPARTGWAPHIHPAAANIAGTVTYLRARLRGRRYMHAGC